MQNNLSYGVVVAISKFFLHFDSLVISYRPIISRISENQFKRFLAQLIRDGRENFFVDAEIDTIDQDIDITDSLSIFKRIWKIVTNIRPTNPSNRPVYRTLDDRLKRLNADKEYRSVFAGQAGLNKDELAHDETYMGVLMAADGYGSASIHGESQEGEELIVRTEDSPVTQKVTDGDDPINILAQLYGAFEKIWGRKRDD